MTAISNKRHRFSAEIVPIIFADMASGRKPYRVGFTLSMTQLRENLFGFVTFRSHFQSSFC